jgi:quinol monooxygenase YgiN
MNLPKSTTFFIKIYAAITALLTINTMSTKAQPADKPDSNSIVASIIRYQVKPEFQPALQRAMSSYISYSGNMDGNIFSEAFFEQDKPSVLWIIERWAGKNAWHKSRQSQQIKLIDSLSGYSLIQPAETFYVNDLEPLSKEQWHTPANKSDQPFVVMLFVDSKPGTENNFKDLYHTAMPLFRGEAGVITYQLSQFVNDQTRFVTYEKFRNEPAFEYHLNFPPIKPVLNYLNTSIKKQPFQTGLHRLVPFAP